MRDRFVRHITGANWTATNKTWRVVGSGGRRGRFRDVQTVPCGEVVHGDIARAWHSRDASKQSSDNPLYVSFSLGHSVRGMSLPLGQSATRWAEEWRWKLKTARCTPTLHLNSTRHKSNLYNVFAIEHQFTNINIKVITLFKYKNYIRINHVNQVKIFKLLVFKTKGYIIIIVILILIWKK